MFDSTTVAALMAGVHREPFALLGLHPHDGAWAIRALLPGARAMLVLRGRQQPPLFEDSP